MPSGVIQFNASTLPAGADLAAAQPCAMPSGCAHGSLDIAFSLAFCAGSPCGGASLVHNSKLNYIFMASAFSQTFRTCPAPRDSTLAPPAARHAAWASVRSTSRWPSGCARILAHSLAPGSWIDEQALCASSASTAPLRRRSRCWPPGPGDHEAAPRRLRHRGVGRDLAEVFHLLALLESDAARVAAVSTSTAEMPSCWHPTTSWSARSTTATLLRRQQAFPHAAAGDRRQPLAHPDGGRPAQVMKLNRAQSLLRQGPAGGFAQGAPPDRQRRSGAMGRNAPPR